MDPGFEERQLIVKFRDGLHFRVVEGRLTNAIPEEMASLQPLLDSIPQARWRRLDRVSEETMDSFRQTAERNLGRVLPDLNLQFRLFLPPNTNAVPVLDALNALDSVEWARSVPREVRLPVPPDLQANQGYRNLPPAGIGAMSVATNCDIRGENVKVCVIEYSYNPSHIDLPAVNLLGGDIVLGAQITPNAADHGTANLGVMASLDNGFGTTGIAPNSGYLFHGIWDYDEFLNPYYEIPGAITTSAAALSAGDVLLLELQAPGTLYAVEWDEPCYDRIVLAVGLGIVVVECAGNAGADFDDPFFSTGNGGHWPFLPGNDSGAILVGAGAAPPPFANTDVPRSRLAFSNYGSTVDLQGWGEAVTSTGYGSLYNLGGPNELYTWNYGGTSSAGPIVAGSCALLQSVFKAKTGGVLTPAQMRQVLISTGSPQQSGVFPTSQNIGPLPNLQNALTQVIPPKVYLASEGSHLIVTWNGCGYLESAPFFGPTVSWTPVEIGVIGTTYSIDLSKVPPGQSRFFRTRWR